MNVKSVVLLGFISKASQYLKEEFINNGQVDNLRSIDNLNLDGLKKAIVEKVDSSFSNAKVSVEELLQVGYDAFDDFITDKKDNKELLSEFGQLFDSVKEPKTNKVKADLEDLLSSYEPIPSEKFVDDDDEYLKLITEAANKAPQERKQVKVFAEPKKEKSEDLDDIFKEIVGNEGLPKQPEYEERRTVSSDAYLKGLISELKSQLVEEKKKTSAVEDRVSVFEKISNLYPYLTGGFIRAVYNLKESIAKENPIGKRIVILHRVYFKDVESLRQFVEIVSNHDYTVNVDESKFVVDVFKEHVNADGKILTNIFEIANQAKVLDGEYEGYRIVKRED